MKKNMIIQLVLIFGLAQSGNLFGINIGKLTTAGLDFGKGAIPDVLGLGAEIAKFIPAVKKIKGDVDAKIKARKLIPATDKQAREINLMEINLEVINLTVLLTGMTAKFLRIVNKATPMLDALVDPEKDPKATKAIGQFKEVFTTITDIMTRINDVNGVMYTKMVNDLKVLKPEAAAEAQAEKVPEPKPEALEI